MWLSIEKKKEERRKNFKEERRQKKEKRKKKKEKRKKKEERRYERNAIPSHWHIAISYPPVALFDGHYSGYLRSDSFDGYLVNLGKGKGK